MIPFLFLSLFCWLFNPAVFNIPCDLVSGMKVYVTDEKELIMEPSMKWAGNPNIFVAVKAFGLRATVQVLAFYDC